MSFILESIKQAERERKLGQQAPSISIEYTGAHVDDIENNKMKWALLSLTLLVTAIVAWSATYYFANKDRKYVEELTISNTSSTAKVSPKKIFNVVSSEEHEGTVKHDIAMVPVKNLHKSDLKSVKLISADEEPPKTKVVEVKNTTASKKVNRESKSAVANVQPKLVTKPVAVSDKQELVAIYSDLAKLQKQEPLVNEANVVEPKVIEPKIIEQQELVQIEAASYIAPKANVTKTARPEPISRPEVSPIVPKHAVSTGVPSFGELPYDIQEQIPDFNVSVHMFHADPMQRRIRINGQMYTEGKSLQQDLALVEITRYGAVFDYQGHLFRFNVR